MSRSVLPAAVAGTSCLKLQSADGASALISRWGAQVLSWQPAGGDERLFLGRRAVLDGTAPIRGGVPLVFPQFASCGPLPAHGFARQHVWDVTEARAGRITLALNDDKTLRALWPHAFACEFVVQLDASSIGMTLRVRNTGRGRFEFQAALHTYLRVDELAALRVEGLGDVSYVDRRADGRAQRQIEPELRIGGEVDRIYTDPPQYVTVREPRRATDISAQGGFTELVVWNPGPGRCAGIVDLEPEDWRHLLCIEAARVTEVASLEPGELWSGSQRLTTLP